MRTAKSLRRQLIAESPGLAILEYTFHVAIVSPPFAESFLEIVEHAEVYRPLSCAHELHEALPLREAARDVFEDWKEVKRGHGAGRNDMYPLVDHIEERGKLG